MQVNHVRQSVCYFSGPILHIIDSCGIPRIKFSMSFKGIGGDIKSVDALRSTNLIVIVFNENPKNAYLFDYKLCITLKSLEFEDKIISVHIGNIFLYILTENYILVYAYTVYKLNAKILTYPNPSGIFSIVSPTDGLDTLCYPSNEMGEIQLRNYDNFDLDYIKQFDSVIDANKMRVNIMAHRHDIKLVQLSSSGKMVATGSITGVTIRVFDTKSAELLYEVKRGLSNVEIYSMTFDLPEKHLSIISDSGTLHLFKLVTDSGITANKLLSKSITKLRSVILFNYDSMILVLYQAQDKLVCEVYDPNNHLKDITTNYLFKIGL